MLNVQGSLLLSAVIMLLASSNLRANTITNYSFSVSLTTDACAVISGVTSCDPINYSSTTNTGSGFASNASGDGMSLITNGDAHVNFGAMSVSGNINAYAPSSAVALNDELSGGFHGSVGFTDTLTVAGPYGKPATLSFSDTTLAVSQQVLPGGQGCCFDGSYSTFFMFGNTEVQGGQTKNFNVYGGEAIKISGQMNVAESTDFPTGLPTPLDNYVVALLAVSDPLYIDMLTPGFSITSASGYDYSTPLALAPEPSAMVLCGVGMLAVVFSRRCWAFWAVQRQLTQRSVNGSCASRPN